MLLMEQPDIFEETKPLLGARKVRIPANVTADSGLS
jgi:hypothetical protein